MTEQELFDTVSTHLMTQRKAAIIHGPDLLGNCRYRTLEGLKCAIGCLIPADKYTPELEGNSVTSKSVIAATGLTDDLQMLALNLQVVHDSNNPSEWKTSLRQLGSTYMLATTVLDNFTDIKENENEPNITDPNSRTESGDPLDPEEA